MNDENTKPPDNQLVLSQGHGRKRRSESRRSSILKKSPARVTETVTCKSPDVGIAKKTRLSRRVSFAETFQVKEFHEQWPPQDKVVTAADSSQKDSAQISGLEQLMRGAIQNQDREDLTTQQVEVTTSENVTSSTTSTSPPVDPPPIWKTLDVASFLKSLPTISLSPKSKLSEENFEQLYDVPAEIPRNMYRGIYHVTDPRDFSTVINTSINKVSPDKLPHDNESEYTFIDGALMDVTNTSMMADNTELLHENGPSQSNRTVLFNNEGMDETLCDRSINTSLAPNAHSEQLCNTSAVSSDKSSFNIRKFTSLLSDMTDTVDDIVSKETQAQHALGDESTVNSGFDVRSFLSGLGKKSIDENNQRKVIVETVQTCDDIGHHDRTQIFKDDCFMDETQVIRSDVYTETSDINTYDEEVFTEESDKYVVETHIPKADAYGLDTDEHDVDPHNKTQIYNCDNMDQTEAITSVIHRNSNIVSSQISGREDRTQIYHCDDMEPTEAISSVIHRNSNMSSPQTIDADHTIYHCDMDPTEAIPSVIQTSNKFVFSPNTKCNIDYQGSSGDAFSLLQDNDDQRDLNDAEETSCITTGMEFTKCLPVLSVNSHPELTEQKVEHTPEIEYAPNMKHTSEIEHNPEIEHTAEIEHTQMFAGDMMEETRCITQTLHIEAAEEKENIPTISHHHQSQFDTTSNVSHHSTLDSFRERVVQSDAAQSRDSDFRQSTISQRSMLVSIREASYESHDSRNETRNRTISGNEVEETECLPVIHIADGRFSSSHQKENTSKYDGNVTSAYDKLNTSAAYDQENICAVYDKGNITAAYDKENISAAYDKENICSYDKENVTSVYDKENSHQMPFDTSSLLEETRFVSPASKHDVSILFDNPQKNFGVLLQKLAERPTEYSGRDLNIDVSQKSVSNETNVKRVSSLNQQMMSNVTCSDDNRVNEDKNTNMLPRLDKDNHCDAITMDFTKVMTAPIEAGDTVTHNERMDMHIQQERTVNFNIANSAPDMEFTKVIDSNISDVRGTDIPKTSHMDTDNRTIHFKHSDLTDGMELTRTIPNNIPHDQHLPNIFQNSQDKHMTVSTLRNDDRNDAMTMEFTRVMSGTIEAGGKFSENEKAGLLLADDDERIRSLSETVCFDRTVDYGNDADHDSDINNTDIRHDEEVSMEPQLVETTHDREPCNFAVVGNNVNPYNTTEETFPTTTEQNVHVNSRNVNSCNTSEDTITTKLMTSATSSVTSSATSSVTSSVTSSSPVSVKSYLQTGSKRPYVKGSFTTSHLRSSLCGASNNRLMSNIKHMDTLIARTRLQSNCGDPWRNDKDPMSGPITNAASPVPKKKTRSESDEPLQGSSVNLLPTNTASVIVPVETEVQKFSSSTFKDVSSNNISVNAELVTATENTQQSLGSTNTKHKNTVDTRWNNLTENESDNNRFALTQRNNETSTLDNTVNKSIKESQVVVDVTKSNDRIDREVQNRNLSDDISPDNLTGEKNFNDFDISGIMQLGSDDALRTRLASIGGNSTILEADHHENAFAGNSLESVPTQESSVLHGNAKTIESASTHRTNDSMLTRESNKTMESTQETAQSLLLQRDDKTHESAVSQEGKLTTSLTHRTSSQSDILPFTITSNTSQIEQQLSNTSHQDILSSTIPSHDSRTYQLSQLNTTQPNTTQLNTTQPNTTQLNTTQSTTTHLNTTRSSQPHAADECISDEQPPSMLASYLDETGHVTRSDMSRLANSFMDINHMAPEQQVKTVAAFSKVFDLPYSNPPCRRSIMPPQVVDVSSMSSEEILTHHFITKPKVANMEAAVKYLQQKQATVRAEVIATEKQINDNNPPIFKTISSTNDDQMEKLRETVRDGWLACDKLACADFRTLNTQWCNNEMQLLKESEVALDEELAKVQVNRCTAAATLTKAHQEHANTKENITMYEGLDLPNPSDLETVQTVDDRLHSHQQSLLLAKENAQSTAREARSLEEQKEALKRQLEKKSFELREAERQREEGSFNRLQQRLVKQCSEQAWTLHSANTEHYRFHFLYDTITMTVTFAPNRTIREINFESALDLKWSDEWAILCNRLLAAAITSVQLTDVYTTEKDLPQLVDYVASQASTNDAFSRELAHLSHRHRIIIKGYNLTLTVINTETIREATINLTILPGVYTLRTMPCSCGYVFGVSEEDVLSCVRSVKEGPRYLSRVVEALKTVV